jgi:hypothetical protein
MPGSEGAGAWQHARATRRFQPRLRPGVRLQKCRGLPKKIYQIRSTIFPIRNLLARAHSCKDNAMTVYERTVVKMQQLPEPLLQEVSDFIDFLLVKHDQTHWELWTHFREALDIAESDFSDYVRNLEMYEESLARGDIRW